MPPTRKRKSLPKSASASPSRPVQARPAKRTKTRSSPARDELGELHGHDNLPDDRASSPDSEDENPLHEEGHTSIDKGVGPSQPSRVRKLPEHILQTHIPKQRASVLRRLAGELNSQTDLVDLDEAVGTVRRTLEATVKRGESNSLLLVGPKGSGKSAVLQGSLASLPPESYHQVYLSARHSTTDRAAMRELAHQLIQTGAITLSSETNAQMGLGAEDDDDDEEDDDEDDEDEDEGVNEGGNNGVAVTGEEPATAGNDSGPDADAADEKAALGTAVLVSKRWCSRGIALQSEG